MAAASSSSAATPSATSANFRNPYTLFPLLMNPDSFNLFLFACHGTIVGEFPVPENTILIQTGDEATGCLAASGGVVPLKAMFEEGEYLRSFTYFLGEGMNTRSGHELISYLAFNVFKEKALEKTLTLNQSDLNSKFSELFGVFKLVGKKFHREIELQKFLINNRFIRTSNMIKHVNHLHPDKVNIFVFFTCADIKAGAATGILASHTHFASPVAPAKEGGFSNSAVAATAALAGGGFVGNGSASVRPAGASAASSGRPAALTPASSLFTNVTPVSTDVDPLLVFEESYSEILEKSDAIIAAINTQTEKLKAILAELESIKPVSLRATIHMATGKDEINKRLNKIMEDAANAIQENQKLQDFSFFNYLRGKTISELDPRYLTAYIDSQIPSKPSKSSKHSLAPIRKSIVELYNSLPAPLNITKSLPEDLANMLVSMFLQNAQQELNPADTAEVEIFREIIQYIQYIRYKAVIWYYNKIGMTIQELNKKFNEAKAKYEDALTKLQNFRKQTGYGRRLTRRQRKQRRSSRHR